MAAKGQDNGGGALRRAGRFLAQRPLLTAVVALAVILVLYLRVALPISRQVADVRDRTERQYDMARTSSQVLEKMRAELAREQAAATDLDRLAQKAWDLAPEPATDRLRDLASGILRQEGMTIERVTPLKPEKSGRFQVVRVNIVALGDWEQIKKVLGFARGQDDFVFISSYKLSPHAGQDGMLLLDLTCAALLRGDGKG